MPYVPLSSQLYLGSTSDISGDDVEFHIVKSCVSLFKSVGLGIWRYRGINKRGSVDTAPWIVYSIPSNQCICYSLRWIVLVVLRSCTIFICFIPCLHLYILANILLPSDTNIILATYSPCY